MTPCRIRNALLLAAVICLISPAASPQNPNFHAFVHGTVRDAVTHNALNNVVVMVEAATSGYAGQVQTDSSGNFRIEGLIADVYVVHIRVPGYEEMAQRVDLTVTSSNYLNFELRRKPGNAAPSLPPEGPRTGVDARLANIPEKARKEFFAAREAWQKGQDPEVCVKHLQKATKIYPQFGEAYVLWASVEIGRNQPLEAEKMLQHAIEIDPKLPEAWFTLGMLQNREKNYADAEKNLLRGLQLDQRSAQGQYELAKTYWALGRWQNAEPYAINAAAAKPPIAAAHVLLGNIALRKNDLSAALKEFQEYLQLDPNGPMADGSRTMIKKLQETSPNPK